MTMYIQSSNQCRNARVECLAMYQRAEAQLDVVEDVPEDDLDRELALQVANRQQVRPTLTLSKQQAASRTVSASGSIMLN